MVSHSGAIRAVQQIGAAVLVRQPRANVKRFETRTNKEHDGGRWWTSPWGVRGLSERVGLLLTTPGASAGAAAAGAATAAGGRSRGCRLAGAAPPSPASPRRHRGSRRGARRGRRGRRGRGRVADRRGARCAHVARPGPAAGHDALLVPRVGARRRGRRGPLRGRHGEHAGRSRLADAAGRPVLIDLHGGRGIAGLRAACPRSGARLGERPRRRRRGRTRRAGCCRAGGNRRAGAGRCRSPSPGRPGP